MMLARTSSLARTASRQATLRSFATKEPKLHKAKDHWESLSSKRPIDADDQHLVFHTPFNTSTVVFMLSMVVVIGAGSMQYGFVHQQYKQGFWK